MFKEPAMFKPLSYSSEFVSIRQPLLFSTDNASFKTKNIRTGSPDLFMSMLTIREKPNSILTGGPECPSELLFQCTNAYLFLIV